MGLFSITCTTCKSRLQVRDQAAIGQILACPKCGGMVMVKAPPAFQEASEQRSDVPTATELSTPVGPRFDQTLNSSAFDVVDELLSDAPPKVQQPAAAATPPPSATPTAAKPRFVGGPKAARPATLPAAAAAMPPPPPEPTKPAEAAPPRRGGGRHWLLIAASVGLGVTLAFGAVTATVLALRGSQGPVRPAKAAALQRPEPAREPAVSETAKTESPTEERGTTLPDLPAEPGEPSQSTPSVAPPDAVAASTAPSTDPSEIVQPPPASAPSPLPVASGLAKFDNLLGGGSDDPLAQAASLPPPPPALPAADSGPAKPLAPRPPPREVDVAKRLADPLLGIETAGTPLADFIQLLSDLSTIPMTLELPLTPATTETPVVLKLGSTTVGGALAEGLRPLRLEYVAGEGQLVIRRIEPEEMEPISRSVKDLTGGDETQLAELAELLRATVEPSAWSDEAGGSLEVDSAQGQLVITQRRWVQLQVLLALEKLRAARRPPLPAQLQFEAALFAAATRSTQAAARLEKSVSFNFSQPTRLLTILERLGEAAGMRIVVDWQDVAAGGWNPAAEAKLLVSGKPLAEALDLLLDPLDLAWRVIDAQTVQVVTPARLTSQGEFEIHPVESLVSGSQGDALVERVRTAMAQALTEEAGGGIRYDESTQCLVAWLPQPHQQVLELLLARWKEEIER